MSAMSDEDRALMDDVVCKFIDEHYSFEERGKRAEEGGPFGGHWSTFAEMGWLMLPFSEAVGGMGGEVADAQVLTRSFGRGLIDEPWLEAMLAGKVLEHGASEQLRERWLTALMSGELVLLLAHGESKADLDFSQVRTSADSTGQGFRLQGTKRVVWQAGAADYYLVSAMIGEEPGMFLVEKTAAGIELSEYPAIDSRQAADIRLDGVEVGVDSLVCSGAAAELALKRAMLFGFAALLGEMHGIAEELTRLTAEYLNTREQFGTRIANFQALQHMLADMVIAKEEIHSLRWMNAGAAGIEDLDERERLARASKARAVTAGRRLCETGVQLHGGVGLTDEYVASHYLHRMIAIDACYGDTQQQLLWLAGRY